MDKWSMSAQKQDDKGGNDCSEYEQEIKVEFRIQIRMDQENQQT